MKQYKSYQYRIYPNKQQIVLLNKTFGCCRFVFNHLLNVWDEAYQATGKGLSRSQCSALLPIMKQKEETNWLKEVDSIALQSSVEYLSAAFHRFFTKQTEKPRFKSKKNPVQSYTTKYTNGNIVVGETQIKLPKLGMVRYANSRMNKGRIVKAT